MYRLKSIAELMLDRWFVPSAVSVHPYIEANSNVSAAVTKPGNPETQSVSIAGRRSANKGRGLFLTVAYFNARLPSAPFVCMAGWWFISPVLPLLLLAPVRPASRRLPCVFFSFLSARRWWWQVFKVKRPQDDAFLSRRSVQKVHRRQGGFRLCFQFGFSLDVGRFFVLFCFVLFFLLLLLLETKSDATRIETEWETGLPSERHR